MQASVSSFNLNQIQVQILVKTKFLGFVEAPVGVLEYIPTILENLKIILNEKRAINVLKLIYIISGLLIFKVSRSSHEIV